MFSSPPYDMTPTVGRLNLLLAYMETNALNIYFSQIINPYICSTYNFTQHPLYAKAHSYFIFQEF